MRRIAISLSLSLVFLLAGTISADNFRPRKVPVKPDHAVISPGYDARHVEVKFLDDKDIGLSKNGSPLDREGRLLKSAAAESILATITEAGGSWRRMCAPSETEMDRLRNTAQQNLNRGIADLNNYFILTVPEGIETVTWIDRLNALPEVEMARTLPLPPPPPLPDDYQYKQGYLNDATDGIGAISAWGIPGGLGDPSNAPAVKICDFEYAWNDDHYDLPTFTRLIPSGMTPSEPYGNDHGTAVMGVIVSLNNGWGTTGAAYEANPYVAPVYLNSSWQLTTAMTHAMPYFSEGDVWLIEQHLPGPNYPGGDTQQGYVSVEWIESCYNVILTAIGNGIHVVEAAGNGSEDFDDPIYSTGNGGHWPFLPENNSGAIYVGGGAVPEEFNGSQVDRSRLTYSNYGSRLDVQGWGEQVMTTGYGDYYSTEGEDYYYTSTFNGTSSSSPVVASAVIALESIYRERTGGGHMDTDVLRDFLKATGSPQQDGYNPASEHIGPRPDVLAAIEGFGRASAENALGAVPFTVDFESIHLWPEVDSIVWDFGDGSSSPGDNPSHEYQQPGYHTVIMSIYIPDGRFSDTAVGLVSAYADTMRVVDATGSAGDPVRVDVSVHNYLPVKEIMIPFSYGGPLNLVYDSVSTAGLRTEYFEQVSQQNFDPFNKRITYFLNCSSTGSQPYLDPGDGPVLSLWFTIPSGAPDEVNPIELVSYISFAPRLKSYAGQYQPATENGSVSPGCCSGSTVGNMDCTVGVVDMGDLTILIDHLFISLAPLCCIEEGDVDLSGQPDPVPADVDMGDLTKLIDHLFISLAPLPACP